jgi:membrane-bound lytic murein transglycosylase D
MITFGTTSFLLASWLAAGPGELSLTNRSDAVVSDAPALWSETFKNLVLPPRARLYVPMLKPVFAEEKVPAELVWLADVESRFSPQARSQVGAVGLFQIMPDTAFILGLAVEPQDERRDPVKSARACAQYLNYLAGKFADWRLVLAAYNAGEGRVRRLLGSQPGRTYDDIALQLPLETQLFVPNVELTILIYEGVMLSELKLAR